MSIYRQFLIWNEIFIRNKKVNIKKVRNIKVQLDFTWGKLGRLWISTLIKRPIMTLNTGKFNRDEIQWIAGRVLCSLNLSY